jgi:hypothetical protein
MKRLLLVLLTAGSLIGCSAVRVGYNQLDWLIPVWFESYVTLSESQKIRLRQHTDELIAWHCRSELTGYSDWLRKANSDFQDGITRQQLQVHIRGLDQAWTTLADQAIPRVADMLSTLSDDQVDELIRNMEEGNTEYREEYMIVAEPALRKELAKRAGKSFDRWFGRLTPEQKQLLTDWSGQARLMHDARWSNRMAWQKEFRWLLSQRHNKKVMSAGLRKLVVEWDSDVSPGYRQDYEFNEALVLDLIVNMGNAMTAVQKQYMERKTNRYAADFDYLACKAPVEQVALLVGRWR